MRDACELAGELQPSGQTAPENPRFFSKVERSRNENRLMPVSSHIDLFRDSPAQFTGSTIHTNWESHIFCVVEASYSQDYVAHEGS